MEFDPQLPEHNDNISPTHPLKEFAILVMGLLLFFGLAYLFLGLLVDWAVRSLSPEMEMVIFNHVPTTLISAAEGKVDPRQKKLQQITDNLRHCLDITTPITVYLQESSAANAMALPGGRIVVLSGLLDKVDSENGLSFVLGHELGHFKHRDHLRGLGRGIVLMALAVTLTGPDSSLTRLITPTIGLTQAHYSQGREALADRSGLIALHCYYGHVGGAVEFFTKMAGKKDQQGGLHHFFASHPAMIQRIQQLKQEAAARQWPFKEPKPLIFAGD